MAETNAKRARIQIPDKAARYWVVIFEGEKRVETGLSCWPMPQGQEPPSFEWRGVVYGFVQREREAEPGKRTLLVYGRCNMPAPK